MVPSNDLQTSNPGYGWRSLGLDDVFIEYDQTRPRYKENDVEGPWGFVHSDLVGYPIVNHFNEADNGTEWQYRRRILIVGESPQNAGTGLVWLYFSTGKILASDAFVQSDEQDLVGWCWRFNTEASPPSLMSEEVKKLIQSTSKSTSTDAHLS